MNQIPANHSELKDVCKISNRDERKAIATHFTHFLVNKKLLQSTLTSKEKLVQAFLEYQSLNPSHVKSNEIISALAEAKLLKKKRIGPHGDNNSIEFKDQIFQNTTRDLPHKSEIQKPRLRIFTNQNYFFKNRLIADPDTTGDACNLCYLVFGSEELLLEHCRTSSHLLKKAYRNNKQSFLTKLENVEFEYPLEFNFKLHCKNVGKIKVKNVAQESYKVTIHGVEVLRDVKNITLECDIPKTIQKGEVFVLKLKATFTEHGGMKIPIVLKISVNDSENHLDVLLEPQYVVIDDDMKDLLPDGPYEPTTKNVVIFEDLPVISGNPVPKHQDALKRTVNLLKAEVPRSLTRVLNHGFKTFANMTNEDKKKLEELKNLFCDGNGKLTALDSDNYFNRFQNLVWIEEHQMNKDILLYNLENVVLDMSRVKSKLLGIKVPGLQEKRPSVLPRDTVYIREKNDKTKYEGIVHLVEESLVYVSPHKKFIDKYAGEKVDVQFTFSRHPLKLIHRALNQIERRDLASLMFPSRFGEQLVENNSLSPNELFNPKIKDNPQQFQAVQNIIHNTAFPAPYIIFGPPGTGKTATLVEAIMQIWKRHPQSRICVSAPSNAAADLVAERLLQRIPVSRILRIYTLSRFKSGISPSLMKCCNYDELKEEFYYPDEKQLLGKSIIVATPITLGRFVTAGLGGVFNYLFIDEAGHAIETELLVPIIGLLSTDESVGRFTGSLVLTGDPSQLGPIIRSHLAIKWQYGISLLERLMNEVELYKKLPDTQKYESKVITKLLHNYRSHKEILHIPNKCFYDGQLEAKGPIDKILCACNWEELPKPGFPMIFHSVSGLEDRERNSPSYFNLSEIKIVCDYIQTLIGTRLKGYQVKQEDIGVITPYRKQVQKMRSYLQKKRFTNVTVDSVEQFQGQERLIIIISTVRSRKEFLQTDYQFGLGFLRNAKRFNVAVTRAKALLIVVGNPDILQCDKHWKELMDYCRQNSSFRGKPPSGDVPEGFDVNERLIMDLGALTINADNIPAGEKPEFDRRE